MDEKQFEIKDKVEIQTSDVFNTNPVIGTFRSDNKNLKLNDIFHSSKDSTGNLK